MINMKAEDKEWIESILKKVEFVQWDRFLLLENKDIKIAHIYGWIEKENSGYKDFVLLEFDVKDKKAYMIVTSSDKHSEKLCQIFNTEHNKCRRVEDNFHIENSIKLNKKEVSPTDLAKG